MSSPRSSRRWLLLWRCLTRRSVRACTHCHHASVYSTPTTVFSSSEDEEMEVGIPSVTSSFREGQTAGWYTSRITCTHTSPAPASGSPQPTQTVRQHAALYVRLYVRLPSRTRHAAGHNTVG
jgi:hypothetical protein